MSIDSINAAVERAFVKIPPPAILEATEALRRTISAALPRAAIEQFQKTLHDTWLASAPNNWHGLRDEMLELADLVDATGISVVWAPREAVIRQLLAADPQARSAELARWTNDVLDDLDEMLTEAQMPESDLSGHADACAFAAEAIAEAREGHFNSAQALAACGLGPVLHDAMGMTFGRAFKKFSERNLDDATLELLKVAMLEVATAKALTNFEAVLPDGFTRHATQHGERSFFSQSNALSGLLLLVGWLREFKWLSDNQPEVFDQRPNP
jgi:hypothetical protein